MIKKHAQTMLAVLICIGLIVGCSNGEDNTATAGDAAPDTGENNDTPEEEQEDITLVMATNQEGAFEELYKGPVEEQFPHITMEWTHFGGTDAFEDMAASGADAIPDIIRTGNLNQTVDLNNYQITADLTAFIEQANFDLERLEPSLIQVSRAYSPEGELHQLPEIYRSNALTFNKDIFDLFGVNYPENGMNWDEIAQLAVEVTGERDGIQYRGLAGPHPLEMAEQLGGQYLDLETDEPLFLTEPSFMRIAELLEFVYRIPGNYRIPGSAEETGWDFWNEQNTAMQAAVVTLDHFNTVIEETGTNFGIVTYPFFPEAPNLGPIAANEGLALSRYSTHATEAFRVVDYLLSDAYQKNIFVPDGRFSPLLNPEIHEATGANLAHVEGIDIPSTFYSMDRAAGPSEVSDYHIYPQQMMFRNRDPLKDGEMNAIEWLEHLEYLTIERIREAQEIE